MKLKDMIGSVASRFAAIVLALTCAGGAWGAEPTTIQNAAGEDITVHVVADGFYQNAATYSAATDFYITNLNGLKYFRDLVNAEKTVSTNYVSRFVSVGNETANAVRSWHTGKMFANKTVHLMEDIDLNNEQWTPIGYSTANVKIDDVDVTVPYFVGVFDGGIYDTNNELTGVHKISNMRVIAESSTEKAYYAGLFGYCSYSGNVGIKNLAIENAYVHSASGYVGAFVASFGSGNGNHIIENCHLTGTIDIDGNYRYVGGIVGYARGKIKDCSIEGTGTISCYYSVGGITGYCGTSGSEVSGCMVSGVAVSGDLDYNVGGIAGFAENIVISNNLITAAMVNASSSGYGRVGGVVGFSSAPSATYLVVVDNVIENTTVEVNGTSIPTKIGLSQDNAIVGRDITYDGANKVTGGIFEVIPAAVIADGLTRIPNTDQATSAEYPYTVGIPQVAQIGANKYETLAEAIAAVPTDGTETTITMIANEAIDIAGNALAIAASKNVVLDLNGFQVVGFCSTGENSALILNNGTLTIVDSSDVNADGTGTGKLAYSASPAWNWSGVDGDYSGSYASNLISNNGTVSVESGLLEVINPAGKVISASFAIDSAPGAVVNIIGGKLTSSCCDVIRVRVNNSSQSALNISGGSVVAVSPSNRAIWVQDPSYNGNSTVTISGGLVSGPGQSIQNDSSGNNAKTTITGGTFNGFFFTYSELDISDGTFNGGRRGSSTVYSVSAYGSKSHISGGVFNGRAEFYSPASPLDWSVTGGAFANGGPYQYAGFTSEEFVRGGIYDAEPLYIAPGFVLADNPDADTKDAYPYAVVPAVASITSDDKTTYYADLQTAIADAETGDTVTLLTDIELTEYQTIQGSTAKYGVIIDKAITIDGAGYTVTGSSDIARTFAVMNTTDEVTIKNITIKNSVAGAVCVYTYDVASLVLDNATLDTTGCPSGYNQPLTISGSGNVKSNVDVLNGSVVKTNDAATQYYAIIVWTPVDLTIDHSTVKGWACVYMKSGSAGSTVEITDSTLVSTGLSGSSDNFAALVTEADNVTMDVTGTEIDISAASGTYQGIGLPCKKSGVSIELGAGNNVTLSGDMAVIGFNMSHGDVTVSGGTFNKAVSDYYCAEGYIPVAQDSETGLYTVKEGVYRAQIVADGYATLSASISEASDDVYLDMWGFWNMKGMVDESGNECPQYVAITDDTMYRDLAIVSDDGVEAWVSAKYIYDNYLAPGKTYYGYQTYYLNEIAPVVKARYETLADAIAAVPTDGMETTIQMIADSVEAAETAMTIASTQNVVIDLAGHTVSGTFAESKTAERDFIKNHGTLTVKDSSAAGTGKITMTTADSDNLYGSQNVTIYNEGGTFTLEGGCIENLSGYCAYAIVNSSNSWDQYIVSRFNMTGGSVSCPHGDQALRVYQNCAATQNENYTCQNYVNISGGTIVDTGIWLDGFLYTTGWDLTSYTGENIKTVVDISGGTINGLFDYSVRHPYNTEVKISGGTFTECRIRVRTDYTNGLEDDASPAFAISGGKFAFAANGGLTLGSGTAHHNVPYLLTGGYYTSEPAAGYVASGYGVYDGTTEYPYAVLPEHPVVVADQTTIAETTLALTGAGDATKFRLDEVSSDGKDRTKGAEQDVSSFSVDLENEMNSATVKYYQIVALKETTSSTEEDTSSAVIGVMKIESNQKNVIIPIPWASLSSGGEISVANLVRTATLTKGDTIEAYDAGTYKAWTLGSDGQWEASSVTSTSGTDKGTDADKFTIPRGAAVWLTRKDPSTPIYLVGAAASGSASITLEAGDAFEPSWNLVGNPTAAAVSVANVAKSTDDKIVVPTATVPKTYYYNESEQSWGYWTTEEVQIGSIAAVKSVWKTDDASIPAGTGFWYLNGGEAKNLWTGVEDEFDLDDAPTTEDTTGNL